MVSILQRVLSACESNSYNDEEFFAHLALAKKLPDSNHLGLALKKVPADCSLDQVISLIFECASCSFETVLPLVTECKTKKYRARSYCILATHFPDKRAECLEKALRDHDRNDKVLCQIARTFQNIEAAKKIAGCYRRTVALLEICLESLETDAAKADKAFRQALLTKESGREICDLFRAIALKATLQNLKERTFYVKSYFAALEKMEAKIQARHCKQLFRELIAKNKEAAVTTVQEAKKMPVIAAQGALIVAEAAEIDVLTFASMDAFAKEALGSVKESSFRNHAIIRLATLHKAKTFPKGVDKDIVTTARWIHALYSMGKKKRGNTYLRRFPSQVKTYLESITTASYDQYRERRDTLLKAALKLIKDLPDIALELVRLALPTLANDRLYNEHIAAVVAFAVKQSPSIQERIIAQIDKVLKQHRKLHIERPDNIRLFIELIKTIQPLSTPLALQLIAQARDVPSSWKPDEIANALYSYPAFQQVRFELYEEALSKDPNNFKVMVKCAELSTAERKEELLGKALDVVLSNKDHNTNYNLQSIISSFL